MQEDLWVKGNLIIPKHELVIKSSRASGPGGQHVNKSHTRIQIQWNILESNILTAEQKQRIQAQLVNRISKQGVLQVACEQYRSQKRNQEGAYDLLRTLIQQALHVPKERKATQVSRSQKAKRLQAKKQRSNVKKQRSKVNWKKDL